MQKIVRIIILFALLLAPVVPASAQTETLVVNATTTGIASSVTAVKASAEMSSDIDRITDQASQKLGSWVKADLFFGISYIKLFICFALFLLVIIFERILNTLFSKKIHKILKETGRFEILSASIESLTKPTALFIITYGGFWAFSPLYPHFVTAAGTNPTQLIISKVVDLLAYIALFWLIYNLVTIFDRYMMRKTKQTATDLDDMLVPLISKALRIFIVLMGAAVILHSMTGLDLGPMLASLGIGGVAIAFAAKDSLANLLGSLTILFDKPFSVGERISIEGYDGTVEEVGFRSTRLRTLTGHQVSIPNEKVVNTSLENIGRRPHLRWSTTLSLTYDTPVAKVEKAVEIVREILENHEGMHEDFPPRVYFSGFGDWSLNIMVLAWYHPAQYWDYMNWLQHTCLKIMQAFEAEGIEFAFPTSTTYLANDDRRQLKLGIPEGLTDR